MALLSIPRQLISADSIKNKINQSGKQISDDFSSDQVLHVIGLLKGCFVFMADLVREITVPLQVDFMEVSSYGNETVSSGNIRIIKDLTHDVSGKHVLIAEDIVDTGLTLNHIVDLLYSRNAVSVGIAALLVKSEKHKLTHKVDYPCFNIGDEYVVGYGLDYRGYYRNLPYIGIYGEEN